MSEEIFLTAQHMNLPPYNDMIDGVSVRGEIVVSKENFELSKEGMLIKSNGQWNYGIKNNSKKI